MIVTKKNLRLLVFIVLALFISYILILPSDFYWIKDRGNYLYYAEEPLNILVFRTNLNNFFSVISVEPLFLGINYVLGLLFLPIQVVEALIFISSLLALIALGKLNGFNFFILFLFIFLSPNLSNYTMTIRNGFGFSIYMLSFLFDKNSRYIKIAAALIHTSLFIPLFIEEIIHFLNGKKVGFYGILFLNSFVFAILLFITPYLLNFLGDRRAENFEYGLSSDSTGLNFLFILGLLLFTFMFAKKSKTLIFSSSIMIYYLISYILLPIGARIIQLFLIYIVIDIFNNVSKYNKVILISVTIIYGLFLINNYAGIIHLIKEIYGLNL
jgi:hypothetical protein